MHKFTKTVLILLVISLSISWVGCHSGLNDTEKAAQKYMTSHAEDYPNFQTSSTLKYVQTINKPTIGLISFEGAYTIIYDFKKKEGTCSASLASDAYLFTFTSDYDYSTDTLTFNVTHITKKANDSILNTLTSMAKNQMTSAYQTVKEASTL